MSNKILSLLGTSGFFLRKDAIEAGLTDKAIRHAVAAGDLVRIRHGAYASRADWSAIDVRERHLLVCRAVLRSHKGPGVLSHHSAALAHGLDLWDVPLDLVHLTRRDTTSARQVSDVRYHEGSLAAGDEVTVEGLPVVPLARAALESACLLDLERALVVVDSALRSGHLSRPELDAAYERMRHWPDSLGLQLVVRLADGRRGSVAESRVGYFLWEARIPNPVLQHPVYDGAEVVGRLDFAWPELGLWLEFDGRVKYEKYLRPGESASDAVIREKKREDRIRELTGWRVIRITWEDLANPEKLAARIRHAMRLAA
jgi:hypothetical protein